MNMVSPSLFYFRDNGNIPNNPHLPALVYRKFFPLEAAEKQKQFQQCFENNGWKGIWKNGIYDYHHFHSSSHEVLGIARGSVEMQLGGEGGPCLRLESGDFIVLPAGTGHKRLHGSDNLVVVGAYPEGQESYDVCRHKSDCRDDVIATIAAVPLPQSDPAYGVNGPLMEIWAK
jgi:uncharacterized protein YjlB